jgi:hypothetical protein
MNEEMYVLNMRTLDVFQEYPALREVKEHHKELLYGIRKPLALKMIKSKAFASSYIRTQMANIGDNELPANALGQDGKGFDDGDGAVRQAAETVTQDGGNADISDPPPPLVFDEDGMLKPMEALALPQIKAELARRLVPFKGNTSKVSLYALLVNAINAAAPADGGEPAEGEPNTTQAF